MRSDPRLAVTGDARVQLGLALQPLVATLVAFACLGTPAALGTAVFVGVAAVPITAFVAYPLLRRLLKRGPVLALHALVAGVVLGNIPSAIALVILAIGGLRETGALPDAGDLAAGVGRSSAVGSLAGLASAGVFWLVAGPRIAAASRASRGDSSATTPAR